MKYISSLNFNGQKVDRIVWKRDGYMRIQISDTESDEVETVESIYSGELYGVHQYLQSDLLVCFSSQAMQLFDHIVSIKYEHKIPTIGKDTQVCVWNWLSEMPKDTKQLRYHELQVDCNTANINLRGKDNCIIGFSVVHEMHFSLYDFILFINSFTGRQVQYWGRVVFFSKTFGYSYTIEFKHDAADDRFFTKMALMQG